MEEAAVYKLLKDNLGQQGSRGKANVQQEVVE